MCVCICTRGHAQTHVVEGGYIFTDIHMFHGSISLSKLQMWNKS